MAIEKKLIHFGKLADFEAQLTAGNILDRSIVFIQDAKKIWTHGTYYDCSEGTAAGDIVQSDWNENDPVSDSYIQGRTHYSYDVEQIALFSIASKNEGDILVTGLYDGGFYNLYNQAGGKSQAFHFVEGRKVPIHSVGPTIEAVCTYEDDYCLKLTTPTYGMNESFSLREMYVEQLKDIYVPETIARTSELKTINGESILGEGDITIEGGESSQPMVSTTWAELKEMRDSASLVAGTWYRITDYVTTTSQSGTRSLEHPFDVIVLATGADTLSEEARAARHEGDVSVSVSLMGMSFFYKGVLTVDGVEWFEFENPEAGSIVSSSATPAIGDIVYPYVDGMVATEEAYPIESVSESENEYFLNNNANLDSWKIWYCLDNDKMRFPWAVAKTKKSIVVQMDETTLLTAEYNGTYEYEGIMYYRWDVFYLGMTVSFFTVSDNPKVGDTTSIYGILGMGMFVPSPLPIISVVESSENEGLGVIYRMIDEQNNDIPYDFKNIQFVRKITLGKLDLENGTDEFVFTFNSFDKNTGRSYDLSFNRLLCGYNTIKSSLTGLNDIVFLSESTSLVSCHFNTFGYNCHSNTFGNDCHSNTFGNDCGYITFGNDCHSNTFGYGFYFNTFGNDCHSNTFGNDCQFNTFGYNCYSNTFGNDCHSNTFGNDCHFNTFGYNCHFNTFGYGCHSNTFGYNCHFNTFGYGCHSNTFGNDCGYNTFGYGCHSNTFGNDCGYITFGESTDALVYYVMYYTLANSVKNKFLSVEGNRSYETKVAYNSIGELKMYCEADLAD